MKVSQIIICRSILPNDSIEYANVGTLIKKVAVLGNGFWGLQASLLCSHSWGESQMGLVIF